MRLKCDRRDLQFSCSPPFNFPSQLLTSRNTLIDVRTVLLVDLVKERAIDFPESSFKVEDYFASTDAEFRFCLMTFHFLRASISDS